MSDDSVEKTLKILSIQDKEYLKNLKEKTYRQVADSARQARNRPFNYLEYPLLRDRIVRRDEKEYDLMPGMYLNYPDPQGDIRDMASNVMGKKFRNKLTMRKDRLKFAKDKLNLAKLMNTGIIPEDVARRVARRRFNLKGGTNNSDSSELTDEQELKDVFLSGIEPDPDIAIRRIQSRHRGNLTRKKSRRPIMEPEPEPEYVPEPVFEPEPEPEPEQEYDPDTLLNLPTEIQDIISKDIYEIRLEEQEDINKSLISEIATSGVPPPQYIDLYFTDLIMKNIPGLNRLMLKSLMNMDIFDDNNKDYISRALNKIFGFPIDVANIFISIITKIKPDDIDPLYSSTTFSSFLNYLIFDNINNLRKFEEKFRKKISKKLKSNYTPFEIENFITDFLNAFKPVKDMKGGTNSSDSELTNEKELKDAFLSGIEPAWKSEPIIPRDNESRFLKHITDLPFDLQGMVGDARKNLVAEKMIELKDIKTANEYFKKKLNSKYRTRLNIHYNLSKNISKYKKNVSKGLINKKIKYDSSYINEINELFSFNDYKVSEIFVKILIEFKDDLHIRHDRENSTLAFLLQYIYDNGRINQLLGKFTNRLIKYELIRIFKNRLKVDDSIDINIKVEMELNKILFMLE